MSNKIISLFKRTINDIASSTMMKYDIYMVIDGVIEPIYFLITSFGFAILSFINYRKSGKTLETIYLSILTVFFVVCFVILNFY